MKRLLPILLFSVLLLAACTASPAQNTSQIEVQGAYVQAVLPTTSDSMSDDMSSTADMEDMSMQSETNGAGYMLIRNTGGAADQLLKVASDAAGSVELHESKMEGDTMSMQPISSLEVPAGGQVELKQGSYHIMFMGLNPGLKAGDKVQMTLTFEQAGDVVVEAEIRTP